MKIAIVALFLFATSAHAESLVCALKETKNPSNYSSVKVDLDKIEDYYYDQKGIDIGRKDNYSYGMSVTREGNKLEVSATFTENKHVQDEVSSSSWTVNLKKAKRGEPVINEPLNDERGHIMDFVCYYNR